MSKRSARQRAVLQYPSHWFKPEELLSFLELKPFTRAWQQLGLSDQDLEALQVLLMTSPRTGDVIEGTGGVRKARFAKGGSGKSGGLRVCYAYFEEVATIVLAFVYPKSEMDDLSDKQKVVLRAAVQRVENALLSKSYRCNSNQNSEGQ